jgi:hypothetical protein
MKAHLPKISRRIADHVVQAALIFTSVFLAFWLSDRRQARVEEERTREAISAVVNEIRSNKGVVERYMPALERVVAPMEAFLERGIDTVTTFDVDSITHGDLVFSEVLTYESWNYLERNDTRIALDKRLLIGRIYRQQRYVDAAIQELADFYKQREIFDTSRAAENHWMFYRAIKEIEGQSVAMLREYEYALGEL